MTKTITIVTGSVRPHNVGETLLPKVQALLETHDDVRVQVANLRELQLPFFDAPVSPMDESFTIEDAKVQQWQRLITASNAVVLLVPEYNHQMSAMQKNALDWLYKEWSKKPVATVSYGWGGGEKAAAMLQALLEKLEATPLSTATHLYFTKDIALDGTVLDEASLQTQLTATVNEVVAAA
ncbi:MAG: NADPH-dependent FMN reductase [Candidatus Saccharimonadales bacterium]